MGSSLGTSPVGEDTSTNKNPNGQPLRPHTGLNNLQTPIKISRREKMQVLAHLLRGRLILVPHNNSSGQTQSRSPTSKNHRILMLKRPIANFVPRREGCPSFPFSDFLVFKEILSSAFPERVGVNDRHDVMTGRNGHTGNPSSAKRSVQGRLTRSTCRIPTHAFRLE